MKSAAIAAAVVLLALCLGCGKGEDSFEQHVVDLTGASPEVAYVALNCAKCHGVEVEGQRTAPKLTGLSSRWTEDQLIAYLRDPKAVQAATPRLAYMAEQFPIEMPAYPHTDEAVLRGLVGWLLAQ
ncbi:MAG: cytochrome c [Thermoanaerobaculales bacterium]|jgi:cytochrome c553|nr:cytochrome c [Thermoanaerobaculales bacterium]